MKCESCDQQAISTKPSLCADHFKAHVIQTVKETIEEYNLFTKEDKLCVAVSGGKDSLALLDILTKLGYSTEGLYIDEGISNYREITEKDLHSFVEKNNLKLRTVSFKDYAGFRLDDAMQTGKVHACTVCGTLRRYLLNKYAKEYDVIATGHNMDDEAQTVLINLARGNSTLLFRSGPTTQDSELFVRRVKPLYFVSEKHILTYTLLHGIKSDYIECPYAPQAYRAALRDQLNVVETMQPHTKRNVLKTYLALKDTLHKQVDKAAKNIHVCAQCGEASTDTVCKTCKFTKEIRDLIQTP
jgi:uncharacterized protein (TIGR00269 family)